MNVDDKEPPIPAGEGSTLPNPSLPLSEHVRVAVKDYFARLDGDDISNLYSMVIGEVERPLIQTVLEQCGHNQSKAAQILGLSRSTLRKKMATLGQP